MVCSVYIMSNKHWLMVIPSPSSYRRRNYSTVMQRKKNQESVIHSHHCILSGNRGRRKKILFEKEDMNQDFSLPPSNLIYLAIIFVSTISNLSKLGSVFIIRLFFKLLLQSNM